MVEQVALTVNADCVVCMGARPLLRIVPAPVSPDWLILMNNTTPNGSCQPYDQYFPLMSPEKQKPLFTSEVANGNFTCVNLTGTTSIPSTFNHTCNVTVAAPAGYKTVSRADIWWFCLFDQLPRNASGTCALVTLLLPVTVYETTALNLQW